MEIENVHIINGNSCFSEGGKVKGKEQLSLKKYNGCVTVETVIHELMRTDWASLTSINVHIEIVIEKSRKI